jgi:hypothetical protein
MKQLLVFALLCLNIRAIPLMIDRAALLSPQESGVRNIVKNKEDYLIITNDGVKKVHSHDVSRSLRKMNDEQLTNFLNGGNGVIKVDRFTNGEFKLDMHVRGNGGGFGGAWLGVVVGQNLVRALVYGPIWIIAGCSGPAAPVVGTFLTGCAAPFVEPVALVAGAVGGMAGMAVTGPV